MSYMKDLTLDQFDQVERNKLIRRTPQQQRREDNGNRISKIMQLVRAGKTMAEALKEVDG